MEPKMRIELTTYALRVRSIGTWGNAVSHISLETK